MNPILSGPEIIKEILLFEYIICLKNIIFINSVGGRLIQPINKRTGDNEWRRN
jgi:hypothetical protein